MGAAESGIKELLAAALAGALVIAVADFIFLQFAFGQKYFTPSLGGGTLAASNPGTGGISPTVAAVPAGVTC